LLSLKRDAPAQLQQILTDVSQGSLTVKTEMTESLKTARTRNQRTRVLVLAILSVGLSFLLASQSLGKVAGLPLVWPLTVALIALLKAIVEHRVEIEKSFKASLKLVSVLVHAAEQRRPEGQGRLKKNEVKAAIRYLFKNEAEFELPNVPDYLRPFVIDFVVDW